MDVHWFYNLNALRQVRATLAGGIIQIVRHLKFSAGFTISPCPPTPSGVTELKMPFFMEIP
jgi:hypothetical protein